MRNWTPLPIAPHVVDAVVLTHAHLDHSGYLPLLVKEGFAGHVYASPGTQALCKILLPDSGHVQEVDAALPTAMAFPSMPQPCPCTPDKMPALHKLAGRGGVAVVPVFAVGRAQALLHAISQLKDRSEIPRSLPVFLDSPIAVHTAHLFEHHLGEYRLTAKEAHALTRSATMINSPDEPRLLLRDMGPWLSCRQAAWPPAAGCCITSSSVRATTAI